MAERRRCVSAWVRRWLCVGCVVLVGCLLSVGCGKQEKGFTNSVGMKMVLIPAGEFKMGSAKGEKNEKRVHMVEITKPFYLGVTEVTQAQYEAVMGENPSEIRVADRPVEHVTWHNAQKFCEKLSAKEGRTYRLPTEAEWEYACRAGSTTEYCFGDSAAGLGEYAWYDKNAGDAGGRYARPVGQKKPNAWGLYDMHGNVPEWCADYYAFDYYWQGRMVDPSGPAESSTRVLRGGAWGHSACDCRSASRSGCWPGFGDYGDNGFRVALTAD